MLIKGILALVTAIIPCLAPFGALLGVLTVIFGIVAYVTAKKTGRYKTGVPIAAMCVGTAAIVVGGAWTLALRSFAKKVDETVAEVQEERNEEIRSGPALRVDVVDLYRTFPVGRIGTKSPYFEKVVEVTGPIAIIHPIGGPRLPLDPDDRETSGLVMCRFPEGERNTIAALKPGSRVTVRGRCTGRLNFNVIVEDCVIVPGSGEANVPGPAPAPADQERIELSNPEAAVYTVDLGKGPKLVVGWQVKYRFVRGGPRPDATYTFEARFPNGAVAVARLPGKELKAEGIVRKETELGNGPEWPRSLTLDIAVDDRGTKTILPGEATCQVADRTGAAGSPPGFDEHVRLSNAKAGRGGDKIEVSFDIEFLNGSKADDTYFLVVWYPDKSYDKFALNHVDDPSRYAANPGAGLIESGATRGRITCELVKPKGDAYTLRIERLGILPGGRDAWPTVSNMLDVAAP